MARGVNKVILIGNLGDEPLCRTTHGGCSVTNISMVTNEVRRNIDTGETTEYAEWHRVVMWGKLADIAKQYLHKGSQIYIEGKLRTRSFLDKQGQKRSVTEVVADEMQMLGSRPVAMGAPLPQGNTYRRNMNQGMNSYNNMGNMPMGNMNHGMAMNNNYANSNMMPGQSPYNMGMSTNAYAPVAQNIYDQGSQMQSPMMDDIDNALLGDVDPMGGIDGIDNMGNIDNKVDGMDMGSKDIKKNDQEPDTKMQEDEIPF